MEINEFLNKSNIIAVVGVSANQEKWGYKVYHKLKTEGFIVYPVNPKHNKIDNDICYFNLQDLPKKPDIVITIVPPKITERIVKQCKNLRIDKIWMQPGSESKESINFCKNNNIKTVYNICFVVDGLKKKVGD